MFDMNSPGVTPSLNALRQRRPNLPPETRRVPIHRTILADMETPVSVYLKLSHGCQQPGFLLESIEGGARIARYSFIGADPTATLTLNDGNLTGLVDDRRYDDPLVELQRIVTAYRTEGEAGLPRFTGGLVGVLGYDAVRRFEPRVPPHQKPGLGLPEASFHLADTLVVFDHVEHVLRLVSHVDVTAENLEAAYTDAVRQIDRMAAALAQPLPAYSAAGSPVTTPVEDRSRPTMSQPDFMAMVDRAKQYILQGDIFQVVLSQRVDVTTPAHPFTMYRALRTVNPSPYMFFLDFTRFQVVGASPELLVRVDDGVVSNHPIAGTRPRGTSEGNDATLAADLLADEKERAEHIMLVDLGRNDVGRVSRPGSVRLAKLMDIEKFSHVMHIVSNVDGDLRYDLTASDALRACFPAGTVSGAPKVRAMEIIAELEPDARGIYAGAVGYLDFSGEMDTCIALRTMICHDGISSLQAGAGIVADSTPDGEYHESLHKMRALVRAIERAEGLDHDRAHRPEVGA